MADVSDDRVSFGFDDFWKTAYEAFPGFWEVYPRLGEAFDSLLARGYSNVGPFEKVTINLGILAATSLAEVATLVGNGFGHGGLKITRSMLEISINAEYLRMFPEQIDDYMDWAKVEHYKLLQYIRTDAPHELAHFSKDQQDEIDIDFESVRKRFEIGNPPRLRPGWCSVDLAARASKTGFHEAYRLIYQMGNKLLHGTIGGMAMHADKAEDTIRISTPPSIAYSKEALVGAHTCAIRMIATVSKVMRQEPLPSLDVIEKDYTYAWQK